MLFTGTARHREVKTNLLCLAGKCFYSFSIAHGNKGFEQRLRLHTYFSLNDIDLKAVNRGRLTQIDQKLNVAGAAAEEFH